MWMQFGEFELGVLQNCILNEFGDCSLEGGLIDRIASLCLPSCGGMFTIKVLYLEDRISLPFPRDLLCAKVCREIFAHK
jgi:hypothetical protein